LGLALPKNVAQEVFVPGHTFSTQVVGIFRVREPAQRSACPQTLHGCNQQMRYLKSSVFSDAKKLPAKE
jgi:hypothetical protein